MGISSDVFISKEKAREIVRARLIYQQTAIIDKAIEAMDNWDLTEYLNEDSDLYYYNIESDKEEK